MRISYSGLEAFTQCPAKYKYQYIDRIRTPKSKEAVFGTLIHECLKMFHNPSRPTPPSEDELLKYFTEKWDSSLYQDQQEESFAFHQGIQILKNYYQSIQGNKFDILALETSFEVPVVVETNDSPAPRREFHQITGRIDRIDKLPDGSFEIIDYKTSKNMPSQEDVDKNLQLSVYHLGLYQRWPSLQKENRPAKLSLYFLKHGEKISTSRDSQQINESRETIISLLKQIKQSKFEPKQNALCGWCSFQPYCPLYKHKYASVKEGAADGEKIKEIIKEFFEIKGRQTQDTQRMAELKNAINQYCDANKIERVFGDEGYITRLPQQRFSYDLVRLKAILEPLGKWRTILTIDKTKLKKVIDSLPFHLKEEVNQIKKLDKEFKTITISRNSRT